MKKLLGLTAMTLGLMLVFAQSAYAASIVAPDKDNGTVSLTSSEQHTNLYTAGRSVFISSNTAGDLVVAGAQVTLEGNIEQDLAAAGGEVTVDGTVGGDARVAGGTVTINNAVSGDLLVAGGTLHLTDRGSVDGDLLVAGGTVIIDGPVKGMVKINGGDVTVNSAMNQGITVNSSNSFTIGSKAVIPNVTYRGAQEQTVKEGAQVGPINFEKVVSKKNTGRAFAGVFTIVFLIKLIGLLVAGLVLMYLFPRSNVKLAVAMQDRIWVNLGVGLVALIVVPIVGIIISILVVGLYVGIMAFLAWLLMLTIASLVASVVTGAWIISKIYKKPMHYNWAALVIGLIVLSLIYLIPIAGFIVMFGLILMAFGGMIRQLYHYIQSQHSPLQSI